MTSAPYVVRHAFRIPKDGGLNKPYRYYEAGTKVTDQDVKDWGPDGSIADLLANGSVEGDAAPLPPLPLFSLAAKPATEAALKEAEGALAQAEADIHTAEN